MQALHEIARVLIPEGRFAIAVWDLLENSPAYSVAVDLLERRAGPEAADALRAPFTLGDLEGLKELAVAAGLSAEVETAVGRALFPSVRSMVEADLRGWLPVMGVELEEALILEILEEAEVDMSPFVGPDGRMAFDVSAHILSGAVR